MNQHTPVAAASVQHQPSQQKQIVQRAAHSQTAGVHSIPSPLEVSLDTKLELIRTSIPWLVEILSTRTFQEPTNHNNNSQQVLTRLIRPACARWYCRSLRYTRYPGSQYPCCCRNIISRRGYTRNENSNDTSPNRKSYHPCVLVYKIQILSTAVPGICYARTRSYLVLVRTFVPGRL